MNRQLATQPFLAGDAFSIADLCFMPYVEYLALSPAAAKLTEHPRVAAWWSAVSAREAWGKTIGR
jgi:glutathione S-transferase